MKTKSYFDSAEQRVPALEELREVNRYRYLLLQLTRRDILARYKRSVLGVGWTMLNPLGIMLVMTVVFSQLFKSVEAYPAYILSGLIAWNFFSQGTNAAMVGVAWGGSLIQRIYLPRTSFAISAVLTALVNLVLSIVPLLVVMLITRTQITWAILFLPISILILTGFTLGIGLILSTIAVYFPDVTEMYQIVLTAWMYLTPIIYPESIIPERFVTLFHVNPMYHLIRLFRLSIYEGIVPTFEEILPSLVISIITLMAGWILFTSKSEEFAYRI